MFSSPTGTVTPATVMFWTNGPFATGTYFMKTALFVADNPEAELIAAMPAAVGAVSAPGLLACPRGLYS